MPEDTFGNIAKTLSSIVQGQRKNKNQDVIVKVTELQRKLSA
jgi:hypothetical protein